MKKRLCIVLHGESAELFEAIRDRMGSKIACAVISCLVEAGARKAIKNEGSA